MRTTASDLRPLLRDRLRSLLGTRDRPRLLAARRIIAITLILVAAVLALRPVSPHSPGPPGPHGTDVVTAARDLAPGAALRPGDLTVRRIPDGLRPNGSLTSAGSAVGRLLAAPVRAGEPITDVRLLGPADTKLTTGDADSSAVPIRLADAGVAGLLHPGSRVDVVTLDPDRQDDPVLASDATVLAIPAPGSSGSASGSAQAALSPGPASGSVQDGQGRLVVLAVPSGIATRIAASSLRQPVTVTLR